MVLTLLMQSNADNTGGIGTSDYSCGGNNFAGLCQLTCGLLYYCTYYVL